MELERPGAPGTTVVGNSAAVFALAQPNLHGLLVANQAGQLRLLDLRQEASLVRNGCLLCTLP